MPQDFDVRELVLVAVCVLVAITFHEAAHGFVALRCGDKTALRQGRVTLNPLKHIDPFGTVLLPGLLLLAHAPFLFGYAKPVPVDWSALRNPRRDMALVAAAGPGANLALGIVSVLVGVLILKSGYEVPNWLIAGLRISMTVNFVLAFFNMLPIPPLDGSKVLAAFLPHSIAVAYLRLGRFSFLPILIFVVALPLIGFFISAVRAIL